MICDAIWNNHSAASLPRLEGEVSAEVCVIGLGGSGLSCLEELSSIGCRAVGIDAGEVGGGAAGRNGGFLLAGSAAFYHKSIATIGRDRAREIYSETLDEIDRMVDHWPGLARRTGSLRIAASAEEEKDCQVQLRAMEADGWPASWYEGPEGRGLLIPSDGVFQPLERCRRLARELTDQGICLYEQTPAVRIESSRVVTPHGSIACRAVIVAVDGRLELVLPELAGRVRTARLQMLGTAPAPEVSFPRPVYRRWGYEYWQQLPNGAIALGGYRDLGGDDEWTTDTNPSTTIQQALERFVRDEIGVTAPITHRWAASVGYTTSGVPISEEVRPGVWALGGYNGTGNIIGSLRGRRIARMVVERLHAWSRLDLKWSLCDDGGTVETIDSSPSTDKEIKENTT